MTIPVLFDDPYFIYGVIFFVVHLISYYTLLEKINNKIRLRKESAIKMLERSISKNLGASRVIELHREVHKIQDSFESLEQKVSSVFWGGIVIFISSILAWGRNKSIMLLSLAPFFNVVIALSLIVFFINLINLLSWNLKNK